MRKERKHAPGESPLFKDDFSRTPPIFSVNESVWHGAKAKWGTVLEYIGGLEKRYYVEHSRFVWSVPEKYLDSARNKNS